MSDQHGTFRRSLQRVQRRVDTAKRSVKKRLGLFEPLDLVAYRGHGTSDGLHLMGRVVERKAISSEDDGDTGLLRNVINTIRRFESDEIPDALIRASLDGVTADDRTDHEGFFDLILRPERALEPGWHAVDLEILESMAGSEGTRATADVMVPSKEAEFAVISDLDDTVIRTGATDTLTELRIVFAKNARTRSAMSGVAPLYRAFEAGPDRSGKNPFFYVSLSGWGLYDLFEKFLDRNELPKAPIFLQDLALVEEKSTELGSENHKTDTIHRLMDDYPALQFVLIGDSGQEDPETYRDIVRERGDRVRAVLVRDVTPEARDREVRRIVQEVEDMGVQMAAAESSVSLARAAADFGLIHHDAIAAVRKGMVESEEQA